MPLFQLKQNHLTLITEKSFKLERELQILTEKNLDLIFGLQFVSSEFILKNFRIDTLAYDEGNNSFVIIEYKKDQSFSIIDQGYAYLSLMLNNKADVVLEFNERGNEILRKKHGILKRSDIDWSQSKVLFVAPNFTAHQKAITFKDLPIELWQVTRYQQDLIFYEKINRSTSQASIKTLTPGPDKIITINSYTEEEHLQKSSSEIQELYRHLREEILNRDDVEVIARKLYIAFTKGKQILSIAFHKNYLRLWLNLKKGELNDPLGLARDVSQVGHHGNGDYEFKMTNDEQLPYVLTLIEQALKKR